MLFLLAWGVSGVYMATQLRRGWIPHDEGSLAQSAERVMSGELPHRDFTELYTGGLTFLNSFAFRHLGVNLFSLRIVLFVFFLAWVPAVYFIATELAPGWAAAGITLLAVSWSVPNYAAAVPSWYSLFFATFGIAALFRYVKKPAVVWLVLAGVCVGLSFLVKSVALYFLAAVLIYLIFREQSFPAARAVETSRRGRLYFAFVVCSVLALVALLVVLVQGRHQGSEYLEYVLPAATLGFLLVAREGRRMPGTARERFTTLFRMVAPLLAGAALPIALFLWPYVKSHSLPAFAMGVFVLPAKRISGATMFPPAIVTRLPTLLLAGVVILLAKSRGWLRQAGSAGFFVLLAVLLALAYRYPAAYRVVWHTAEGLIPLLALLCIARLLGYPRSLPPVAASDQERLLLLAGAASLCSVVRFPFAAEIYFCYVAPLVVLAGAALLKTVPSVPRTVRVALGGYYLVFAVFLFAPGFLDDMGKGFGPDLQVATLDLARAGRLRVSLETAGVYERLVPFINEHAANGEILAGPDCPEVYFLTGKRNPTPMLFDFFVDQRVRDRQILRLANDPAIKVLVVNTEPGFSGSYAEESYRKIAGQFDDEEDIGNFEVWWRQ
ncbi:MAG: glycosyltransferase family 39 protein [Candidatus Acidiferrales bacterium]